MARWGFVAIVKFHIAMIDGGGLKRRQNKKPQESSNMVEQGASQLRVLFYIVFLALHEGRLPNAKVTSTEGLSRKM